MYLHDLINSRQFILQKESDGIEKRGGSLVLCLNLPLLISL